MVLVLFHNMQGRVTNSCILLRRKDLISVGTFLGVNIKAGRRKEGGRCNIDERFDLALSYSKAIECHSMLII